MAVLYNGLRNIKPLKRAKKDGLLGQAFIERIMLAVTEVNGCEMCSYAHTNWALEAGLSAQEIEQLLAGSAQGTPTDELPAILFAQHYADKKGNPDREAWERIREIYGQEKALGILGAVREIMIGNVYGAAAGAFSSRLKGKPYKNSKWFKELGILLSILVFIPAAGIKALLAGLFKKPIADF
ncbi:MAG TPA: carboxymuconolactone decarboxylase family protein [Clostridia bacterium]|nr:carboxymuconolactone decarboxylase family protein [Clostridia bacterium]